MSTAAESVSRWARRFMAVSVLFLVAWRAAALLGIARRTAVALGVLGFVLHAVFGKAHSLIPSYFDRELGTAWTPPVTLALTASGVVLLAAGAEAGVPTAAVGSVLWTAGVAVFLGTILWTIRDNLTGAETGTGAANAERRPVDRAANAFVPAALAYLALGTYGTLALATPLPRLFGAAGVSHLLAAGAAAVLVFAIGFRLLPRFLVASPPRALVSLVLPAGAAGPLVIAATLSGGPLFVAGALLEAVAVVGFAVAYAVLFARSDRRRVGFYGVLAGAAAGVLAVLLGLSFALVGVDPGLAAAHARLNVLGFLGLTIVGVTYQFYPPTVGTFPGAGDRTAAAAIAALAGGLLLEAGGLIAGAALATAAGRAVTLLGALVHAYLLLGVFVEQG